ncbi:hypothetical protein C7974DRAFT_398619 [Boeremia exigua]|uniref:uncharacterized protein n=1 Tax=Boeremia exigua TaxID=749465 RepID=UPI001E8CA0B5|nr:uncharacterized protein C7974DRAFT_398619 [Boeremia exigua]KAH6619975.1 hypothetical protein C7974DRAFT_398619 [Boeremia exigua]
MSLLGRKFPAQIAKPMWPFYVSGLVILYGVNSAANAMGQGEFSVHETTYRMVMDRADIS